MEDSTRSTPDSAGADPYDDEADVIDYLLALWSRRWLILAATLFCGVAAFVPSYCAAPTFEASVQVLVPKPRPEAGVQAAGDVRTFTSVATSRSIATQVVKEFHLDASPLGMSPDRLVRDALTVEPVRDTNIVVLRVRSSDRDLAAKVANRLADLSVALATRAGRDDSARSRKVLQAQLDAARARLAETEGALARYRRESRIEILRQDVDAILGGRKNLIDLNAQIAGEKARVAQVEKDLAMLPPTAAADDREARRTTARDVMQEELSTSRAQLAALEARKTRLATDGSLGAAQLRKLDELYSKETELARLENDHSIAKTVHTEVATRAEQVRVQQAGEADEFTVLEAALPPDLPVGPRIKRNTVAGFAAGLLLSTIAALAYQVLMFSGNTRRRATGQRDRHARV